MESKRVAQPPEHESDRAISGAHRYEVRRRRHKHGLKRRIIRAVFWGVLGLVAGVLLYYFLGWIADSTYVIDKLTR
jgi:hypothetical protein